MCILEEHSYAKAAENEKNSENKDDKNEATILELVKAQKPTIEEDEFQAIDIDSLNDRQYVALFGTSKSIFNVYLELIEAKLKVR